MPEFKEEILGGVLSQWDGWTIAAEPPAKGHSVVASHAGYRAVGVSIACPPARGGGGDASFAIPVGSDKMLSGLVDSEGHEEREARFMLAEIHTSASLGLTEPKDVVIALNAAMCTRGLRGSACIALLERGEIRVAGAASPDLAIFAPGRGPATIPLDGPILGVFRMAEFSTVRLVLDDKETLAFVTDGVTECGLCCHGEAYGLERLGRLLDPSVSLAANLLRCVDDVEAWARNRHDDFSILLVRLEASGDGTMVPVRPSRTTPRATAELPHRGLALYAAAVFA